MPTLEGILSGAIVLSRQQHAGPYVARHSGMTIQPGLNMHRTSRNGCWDKAQNY